MGMDSDRNNTLIALVILIMQTIIIFLGNGFIIVVNGYQWLQSKKMATCDFLLVSLAASRCMLHLIVIVSQIYYYYFPGFYYHSNKAAIIALIWMFFIVTNLSCVTWLNVFYCVKVANCVHPWMLWLKRRIDVLAPRLLGGSIGVYLLTNISNMNTYIKDKACCTWVELRRRNTSQSEVCFGPYQVFYPFFFCFAIINFSLCITASVILLTSLRNHINNLKKSGIDINDMSTRAHTSVLKHLLFFSISYILFFSFLIITVCNLFLPHTLNPVFVDLVLACYPLVHTIVIIMSNPKLRKVCFNILKIKKRLCNPFI